MNIVQIKDFLIDCGLVMIVSWLACYWAIPIKDLALAPWRRRREQNLAEWLEIATGKLVPSAQTQIRTEIEAHYADAVKSYQDAGLTEASAQARALADLGRAPVAARRYNWEYLTKEEARRISRYFEDENRNDPPPPILQRSRISRFLNSNSGLEALLGVTLLAGLAARLDPDPEGFHGAHLIIVVSILVSLLLAWLVSKKLWQGAPKMAGQKITPALLSRLITFDSIERLAWTAFWTSTFYVNVGFLSMLMTASIAARCSISALSLLRLRRKILSSDAEGLELPPPDPAVV